MDRLSIKDIAKIMNIPEQSVRLLIQQGQIPAMLIKGAKRNTYYIFKSKFLESVGITEEEMERRLK